MKNLVHYHDVINFDSNSQSSTIEIIRVGKVYGRGLTVTESMLDDFISNFENKVYRTDLQVNLRHDREGEAAGWIKSLYKQDGVLFAVVEWTPLGVEKISSKQFRYTSSELAPTYLDPVTGKDIKNVLIGVALTNIPQIKDMAPVSLSELLCSENYLSFYENNMKEKAKGMYADLMKKDKVTKAELAQFAAACKDAGMPDSEMAEMQAKLKAKCSELSEEEAKEEKQEEKLSEQVVSLAEFNKFKALAEKQVKLNQELQERLDTKDLCEQISKTFTLSEKRSVGFVNDEATVSKVAKFMLSLSTEQRNEFSQLLNEIKSVDLGVRGSSNAVNVNDNKENKLLAEANERAQKRASETGMSLSDCLAEEYAKLPEGNY